MRNDKKLLLSLGLGEQNVRGRIILGGHPRIQAPGNWGEVQPGCYWWLWEGGETGASDRKKAPPLSPDCVLPSILLPISLWQTLPHRNQLSKEPGKCSLQSPSPRNQGWSQWVGLEPRSSREMKGLHALGRWGGRAWGRRSRKVPAELISLWVWPHSANHGFIGEHRLRTNSWGKSQWPLLCSWCFLSHGVVTFLTYLCLPFNHPRKLEWPSLDHEFGEKKMAMLSLAFPSHGWSLLVGSWGSPPPLHV